MKLHRTPEQWSKMDPAAVLAGSDAQRLNVLTMLKSDIVSIGALLARIERIADAPNYNDHDDVLARLQEIEIFAALTEPHISKKE